MTTVFVTDADNREVLEYDGTTGQVRRWYAYGAGIDELLGQMNVAANTRTTPLPDIQGSIIATLDSGSGALTRAGFLPFGESAAATGTFRYTGRRIDPETGLYYYRARMYHPAWGRFLQPDPIGAAGGINLYAYVGNDPLNQTDPYGECPSCIGAVINVAIGLGTSMYTGERYGLSQVLRDAAVGAIGGAIGGRLLSAISRALPIGIKGRIGEAVTRVGIMLRGETVIAFQRPAGTVISSLTGRAARATPDFAVRRANGTIGVVEAKFGNSTLTGAQRALRNFSDDLLRESRTSYDDVAKSGGALGGTATGGATAYSRSNTSSSGK